VLFEYDPDLKVRLLVHQKLNIPCRI